MSQTSAPTLESWLTMRVTDFSLPGTGVAEMMTVSPRSMSMVLCYPTDMRASADNGSPWLPVHNTTVFSGG